MNTITKETSAELKRMEEKINFQSEKRIDMLKRRKKRCVCKYCGGELKLKRIIFSEYEDARIEIFCCECNRIEFGVEKEIYASAKYFVENSGFHCFPELDNNERTQQMTIAKVCEIMAWEAQTFGIVDENGFTIPLKYNNNFIGECITLTEDDLEEEDVIENIYAVD